MKRSRSQSLSPAPRKRVRGSDHTYLEVLTRQYAYRNTSKDPLSLNTLHDLSKRYNRILGFVQVPLNTSTHHEICDWAKMSVDAIQTINAIAEEACQRIEKLVKPMNRTIDSFAHSVFDCERWYENGDVFSLEFDELAGILDDMDLSDTELDHYVAYIRDIIPLAAQWKMTKDEAFEARLDPPLHPTDGRLFIKKAFKLIQVIIDHGRDKDAFSALVLLKSVIRASYPRMQGGELLDLHALLDTAIRAFVAREPTDEGAESSFCLSLNWSTIIHVDCLVWRQRSTIGKRHTWYWDFAAAARFLEQSYLERYCHSRDMDKNDEYDQDSEACFHSASLDLLDCLNTKAWSEIRHNVFLTIGTLLPTELTERIFEYALQAEKIDSDPRLIAYRRVTELEHSKLKCEHSDYVPLDRHLMKLRDAYHCCCGIDRDILKSGACVDLDELPWELHRRIAKGLERKSSQ